MYLWYCNVFSCCTESSIVQAVSGRAEEVDVEDDREEDEKECGDGREEEGELEGDAVDSFIFFCFSSSLILFFSLTKFKIIFFSSLDLHAAGALLYKILVATA